ncbi:MAG: DNA-binding response regulator [Pelagibacterium sp. SCN 64-44]|nr:MAG: DNA-binding response regulator [Pelagibacterium sp. SCN 64-44]
MNTEFIVHIVDDDEAVRQSVSFLLSASGYASRTHVSAAAFSAISSELQNACLLTDLRMPDMDGIELLRSLRARGNMMPVIIVTGHGDVQAAVEAMKAGASDFIEKPFSDDVLLTTIAGVCLDAEGSLRQQRKRQETVEKIGSLSHRERQVLDGVVDGQSNKVIAQNLGLSPRTVEVYRATIMTKMNAHNLAELVRAVVNLNG